jgi:hypothetical protein
MGRYEGFIGINSGPLSESFYCELEGDESDLHAILLDVELPDGTSESRRYVPERTAKRVRVPYQSHVALGHYECGDCGTIVGSQDRYCRHCGSELVQ